MADVEFNPNDRDFIPTEVRVEKNSLITNLVMKLSFGLVKDKSGANVIMIAISIIALLISAYLVSGLLRGPGGGGQAPPTNFPEGFENT